MDTIEIWGRQHDMAAGGGDWMAVRYPELHRTESVCVSVYTLRAFYSGNVYAIPNYSKSDSLFAQKKTKAISTVQDSDAFLLHETGLPSLPR